MYVHVFSVGGVNGCGQLSLMFKLNQWLNWLDERRVEIVLYQEHSCIRPTWERIHQSTIPQWTRWFHFSTHGLKKYELIYGSVYQIGHRFTTILQMDLCRWFVQLFILLIPVLEWFIFRIHVHTHVRTLGSSMGCQIAEKVKKYWMLCE